MSKTDLNKFPLIGIPVNGICATFCDHGLKSIELPSTDIDVKYDFSVKAVRTGISQLCCVEGINSASSICLAKWMSDYFSRDKSLIQNMKEPYLCWSCNKLTDFSLKALKLLQENVHFGQTVSYAELAVICGLSRRSCRAIGQVMKRNPFPLIIPCHRVICADGTPGHYSGGKIDNMKVVLLKYEEALKYEMELYVD